MIDDATTLRRRQAELLQTIDRQPPAPNGGNATILCQTVAVTHYPTTAGVVYGVKRAVETATEGEGNAVSTSAVGSTFYACNLGAAVPPVGTLVLCTLIGSLWCFQYG